MADPADIARANEPTAEELALARKQYHPGDCIPVFHNLCGKRTIYVQCRCRTCKEPRHADA